MRILYIQSNFGLGGINKITAVKENYLVNHSFEVHNLNAQDETCMPPDGMYDEHIIMHSIPTGHLNKLLAFPVIGHLLRFIYFRYALLKVIYQVNPDVIVANMPRLEPVLVVWFSFRKKRILEFHGWYNHPSITKISWKERIYYILTSPFYQMVALTKGEADKLKSLTGCNSLYIPNPQYSFPKQISNCENKRVVSMARFSPQKKLEDIIPFWRMVEDKHPDWELHLFGEGPDEPKMRTAIAENNLKTVFIHPYTTHVEEEMAKASIYVFPSMFEGFGLVLLEAMSAGVPCVSYDCPYGPGEIIRNGEDGILSEYNNPKVFMENVLYLIEHDDIRKKMGKKARENSLKSFNIGAIMAQWMKIFNSK